MNPTLKDLEKGVLPMAFFFLCVLWGQFFLALWPTWSELATYRYAFVAAPLMLFFVYRRWDLSQGLKRSVSYSKLSRVLMLGTVFLVLMPLFLIRPLQLVDSFWRMPLWLHAVSVLLVTFLTFFLTVGWERVRLMLPAFLLAFVLVPLPSSVENELVGSLTGAVSNLVGELLPLTGYPVDRFGNTMIVKGAMLDVAEGCSGIRSFQASFMTGLYLGEFYQHGVLHRLLLVGAAILLALLGNTARIYFLTTTAFNHGMEKESQIHETVGVFTLVFIYGAIGLIAWLFGQDAFRFGGKLVRREVIS